MILNKDKDKDNNINQSPIVKKAKTSTTKNKLKQFSAVNTSGSS